MKISVLIPMFNRELYIEKAINSVLNQLYSNLDIIVFDDGSSDNSVYIVKKLMKSDSRIRLIEGKNNNGIGYARNKLIEACNTKYACWVDSDDIILEDKIEKQFESMTEDKVIFTNWVWLTKGNKGWETKNSCTTSKAFATVMFPVNKDIKFNDKKKFGGEDWDWLNRMLQIYKEDTINKVLYFVRGHEDRIGFWKRKIRTKIKDEEIEKYSYAELIERFKNEG